MIDGIHTGGRRSLMGSVVQYRCAGCDFSTAQLAIGWGKAGRARFWGGLALCTACQELTVADLVDRRPDRREHPCARCNAPLALLEGISQKVKCPRCGAALRHTTIGSWA